MDGLSSSVKSTHKSPHNYEPIHFFHPCNCLARIEILVLLTALFMVVRYILLRFRSTNVVIAFLLITLPALSQVLLDLTIGLMQLTKSNNDMYQVWAVVLVMLRYSIRAVLPTGISGKQNPLRDMMSSLWTANLLGTRATLLKIPLWLLWSLNSVRIILEFVDSELISSRHRRHVRLLTEYMRTEHKYSKDYDAKNMKGYKYLVWGEDKQKIRSDPPEYRIRLEVTTEKKFITTNKVWEHNGVLLGKPNELNKLKDLCLAFALFKLLRRRFFGLPIYEANQPKTKDLVLKGLIQNQNYNRAFKIIEKELAFLNDFLFTRYALMFASGFPTLRLMLSLSVIGVASYLALIFYHSSDRLPGDLSKTTNGIVVTWILLVILTMKEIWEMVSYVMSDWTKVVLISNYVQQPWWTRYPTIVALVNFLCKHKIANWWHGFLGQYNLLQSFQYLEKPWPYNLLYNISRCFLFKQLPGYKVNYGIRLCKEVKLAISESLEYLCNQPEALGKYLSTAANSLYPDFEQKIPLTSEFATETQKILVWHMATCYCEMKLATSEKTKFCKLTSAYLLCNLDSLHEGLQSHYIAATALSQNSAYLVAQYSPPLVPGSSLVATTLFRSTVEATWRTLRRSCSSWNKILVKLDELADENDDDDDDDDDEEEEEKDERCQKIARCPIFYWREERKRAARSRFIEGKIILKNGVRLGRFLTREIKTETELWKFLEKFWAGYLLYLAASIGPDGHKMSLFNGGEFITHLWALLTHAGILGKQDRSSAVDDLNYSDESEY